MMAVQSLTLDIALRRRFAFFDRLALLDRRGMHLIDPWPIGAALGMGHDETERVLASLEAVGWVERGYRDGEVRVALTVTGLARR
jgi:DNA-binding IclR family transcriptional regulator